MMRSLLTDPMAWWPLGLIIGGLAGAVLRHRDRGRAARRRDADQMPDTVDELVARWQGLDAEGGRTSADPDS